MMLLINKAKIYVLATLSVSLGLTPISSSAAAYQWYNPNNDYGYVASNPLDLCRLDVIRRESNPDRNTTVLPETIRVNAFYSAGTVIYASCAYDFLVTSALQAGFVQRLTRAGESVAYRRGDSCDGTKIYNPTTGTCGRDKEQGVPDLTSCVGNPISVKSGNKYQQETDFSDGVFEISRHYNSSDGLWRASFSDNIKSNDDNVYISRADGSSSSYTLSGDIVTPDVKGTGDLRKTISGWEYTSPDREALVFDTAGRLVNYSSPKNITYTISYDNYTLKISANVNGTKSVVMALDAQGQPMRAQVGDVTLIYNYENYHLASVNKITGGTTQIRKFLYEKDDKTLLTGIVDERGVRFATWDYDIQGRAISSQHAGGAGLTKVAYFDNSSTVTNELGKQTTYNYQQYLGINRITSIIGEPSQNCLASNSSRTYDAQGQLKSITDAKGLITTYTYNDRGLEASRTEAKGTILERTTFTEWDATRFLPIRITASGRITEFTYDDEDRLLSQQTIPLLPVPLPVPIVK
ncbi:hypothetical protein PSE10C_51900 [Pseudomonas amygdali pv. eriobotryae]|uniref:DUF6531 domain-containing protein n=1 Tax=Pseudomonas amygdali pv. eriobotryae TaxID=129137 RepID=A0A9P3EFS9_PSEA0|nr:DUF6531 domain-containing protein [Pseudomonas amygdali]GFZ62857.1 hypothetical protein PSE10A_53680 [Pseudomonas amygdali pv. eriobotryae]GFZ74448.1 hypothetical protein PSE10C_51900 [Pseudomonas amygdali pv. eriobotryae]